MHFILGVFLFNIYKKKKGKEWKEKGSTLLFLYYSLCFLKTRLVNLFSHDMFVVLCLAKVPVPQAQDPIALIGELVKALNLYSNLGVGNHSNVNINSNARGASKRFWMQKTQSN